MIYRIQLKGAEGQDGRGGADLATKKERKSQEAADELTESDAIAVGDEGGDRLEDDDIRQPIERMGSAVVRDSKPLVVSGQAH